MRNRERETFERFTKDVAEHTLTILKDDGLYRHVRCRRKDSYTYGFDIVTWPGYLAYTGDMGCYVFSRIPDMFEFFRDRTPINPEMYNFRYAAEKCMASDKRDGIREWSEDLFQRAVRMDYEKYIGRNRSEETPWLPEAKERELWQGIEDSVLSHGDNSHEAVQAAMDFKWSPDPDSGGEYIFTDFYEHTLETFTGRFIWCCYALPWAIDRYDALTWELSAPDPV